MLTANLCLLTTFFGILYFFIDLAFGRQEYLFAYFLLIGGCVLSVILLRLQHYTAGRLIYLLSNLSIMVLFSMIEPGNNGIFLFFIVLVVASLTMFGHDRLRLGIGLSLLIIILFLGLYFGRWTILEPVPLSDDYYEYVFGINFIIALCLITLMIHYLIRINYATLVNIRNKEKDLVQLAEELSVSQNRFKLALKGSSAGIWDWDARQDDLYISPLLSEIIGYPLEKTMDAGRDDFFNSIHPEDKEIVIQHLTDHLEKREKFEVEFRMLHGSGDYIWVLDTGQAEWDNNGAPIRMVGSIIDITERKEDEKKIQQQNLMLEKTNAELDRFVYSVSHDLKSPLSSILGLMSIAEMSDNSEEIMHCIGMMRERVDALNGFIEEIIDYSRNTRTEATYQEVNLHNLVTKVLDGLKYMENMSDIRLAIEIDPADTLVTDPGRLKIVLNNLIGNAVKYHSLRKDDPYILIRLDKSPEHITIRIEDNGQGIDEAIQRRVFEMFYRGHESSQGSGLGLYIAREMMRKLHGDIELFSEKGQGSTFIIHIPVRKDNNT